MKIHWRNSRKTGAVSAAPPEDQASSRPVWRPASAPFALASKRQSESGQAVLLVVLGMSFFLIGAAGLALDGSHLYAQRQMAQAAADAAAQAGMLSIFDGTNTVAGNANGFAASTFTCGTSDPRTPCYYAQTLNGFNATTDTVTVDFPAPSSVPAAVSLLRVTIQRQVSTTLMSILGPTVSTISVSGTAAIVGLNSPVPIVVLDSSASGALSSTGAPTLTVCGGPRRGIQVNSVSSTAAFSLAGATIGGCGAGIDFGVFGGPGSPSFSFAAGQNHYIQPASPVADPLAGIPAPAIPTALPTPTVLGNGVSGCPASPRLPCQLYSPGLYPSGIDAQNHTAVFEPGIYYIQSGGFTTFKPGDIEPGDMLMGTGADAATGWTGNMLVYNTGSSAADVFSVETSGSTGSVNLNGSPAGSAYKGILFFEDRSAASHTHSLGGGNSMTLGGSVYLPNQVLNLQGSAAIQGQLVTGVLNLGGSSNITVNLGSASYPVRQVALVQ